MSNIINSSSAPVLFTYLNSSVSNVTGNGTLYTILYDTVGFGDSAHYSAGLYTAPLTGIYRVSTVRTFNNIINSANNNISPFLINGVAFRTSECSMNALKDASNTYSFFASSIFFISAGQTIASAAQINNGSAASVGLPGGTAPYLNWLFIRYLF